MSGKKFISVSLVAVMLAASVLAGCNNETQTQSSQNQNSSTSSTQQGSELAIPEDGGFKTVSVQKSDDKYRTYYEIFPYAFCDSNGDGIGDLKGITSKLDYLNDGDPSTTDDLGIEGIWLMPIMSSPSYHKYNVQDYMTIDKDYGTNDDMKELLEEAHKRNIYVIIDLVINHTSRKHEWYQKAIDELKEGKTDGYAQYYHFKQNNDIDGWEKSTVGNWYYECQFDIDMPDLNLKNEKVREEIQNIVKYWIDLGVDGFRLDAVKWYEDTSTSESIDDLKWLYDYTKSIKEDVYMIGECWDATNIISDFYKSGADSFFNFDMQGVNGTVTLDINQGNAKGFVEYLEKWQKTIRANNPNAIDAPFISNHDTARSAGFLTSNTKQKMAAAMYILSPGNSFIYYGEEIAMTGSETDPDKRKGMYWSTSDDTGYVQRVPGVTNKSVPEEGVAEQQGDENSLLNFYKRVIALKSQNPEIARGTITAVDLGDKATAGYISEYNGSKVMVIFNLSDKPSTVTIPSDKFTANEVRGYVIADSGDNPTSSIDDIFNTDESSTAEESDSVGEFSATSSSLTMPAYSAIVLK